MQYFLFILTENILPIFIQIGIGFLIQRKFKLSIQTLSKIQIYVLTPSLLFSSLYTSDINEAVILQLVGFNMIIYIIMILFSIVLKKILKLERNTGKAFSNSLILSNQGNYLIPLLSLVFVGEIAIYAISLQMMIILIQSFVLNTVGLYNASGGDLNGKEMLKRFFSLPMIYVFVVAVFLKRMEIALWPPVITSIDIMGKSFVTVALLTLGMQLSETKLHALKFYVFLSNFIKLIITPAIAFGLVFAFGLTGIVAKVLIISAASPSAVNNVLWAIEFKGDAEFAAQAVLTSTLMSAVTMTLVIQLVTHFF